MVSSILDWVNFRKTTWLLNLWEQKIHTDRSSRPEVFCKKYILRNFIKSTGKHLCQSLFFNKVAGPRTGTGVFLWILWNFYEHLFSKNTSGGCFCTEEKSIITWIDFPSSTHRILRKTRFYAIEVKIQKCCTEVDLLNKLISSLYYHCLVFLFFYLFLLFWRLLGFLLRMSESYTIMGAIVLGKTLRNNSKSKSEKLLELSLAINSLSMITFQVSVKRLVEKFMHYQE